MIGTFLRNYKLIIEHKDYKSKLLVINQRDLQGNVIINNLTLHFIRVHTGGHTTAINLVLGQKKPQSFGMPRAHLIIGH